MATIYDRADIYDLGFDQRKKQIIKEHWEIILKDTNVKSILDCSIGTGNLTLPLAELGHELSGSDLSQQMFDSSQYWEYDPDGSITFNIVYSFERNMKVLQREFFEEKYNPIKRELILNELSGMGYSIRVLANMPIQCSAPLDEFDWFCVLAQKKE